MQSNRRRLQLGFTAIELLVATSLSTLMMIALLGVLGAITKHQKKIRQEQPVRAWLLALEDQIRWDLANSEWLQLNPQRLRLAGYASHDFVTGERTYRPAEVTYSIKRDRYRTWLVRAESHLDVLSNRNTKSQLICSDVARIDVQPLLIESEAKQGNSAEKNDHQKFDPSGCRIPAALRVLLYTNRSNSPWFSRDIVLR